MIEDEVADEVFGIQRKSGDESVTSTAILSKDEMSNEVSRPKEKGV
jgi:hypothetical protein